MKQIFRILLSVLILWSSVLYAEVHIEITQGTDTARPISVVPFKWEGSGTLPEDISAIITADLRNSGKFNPIPVTDMPQQPTNAAGITITAWTALGINFVIVGRVQQSSNNSYIISYQLVDTSSNSGAILVQNQYNIAKVQLRYAAHTASNEIFHYLTSIKGVFHTRIAYIVNNSIGNKHQYELRIADYDGFNQMLVHRSPQPLMSPSWSPDGDKLAYVTFESGRSTLVIQNINNGTIQQIASFPQHNGAPSFSPDGSKLAIVLSKTGSLNLYIIDLTSDEIHQVTNVCSNNTEPSWFPDNQTLAYTSDQDGYPQVYKISIHNGRPQRLSLHGFRNQDADVSMDGKFLVMVSSNNGLQYITKLDLVTGAIQILTSTFLDESPSIAPNGTMVVYSTSQGLGSILQLVSTDGHFKTPLPVTDGLVTFPTWSPYL